MNEDIITLIDEDGQEVEFAVDIVFEAEGKRYALLIPVDVEYPEDDEEEYEETALVFRIESDEEGDILVPLEDDKEYEIVRDAYEVLNQEGLN